MPFRSNDRGHLPKTRAMRPRGGERGSGATTKTLVDVGDVDRETEESRKSKIKNNTKKKKIRE